MATSTLMPLQWSDIPHINDTEIITGADDACLEEVREVLARHGRLNKFGIALLHYHFPINESEIMVETIDPVLRSLLSRPVPLAEIDRASVMETAWRFGPDEGDIRPMMNCDMKSLSHDHFPGPSEPPTPTTTPTPTTDPSPAPPPTPPSPSN